ncbi:hypothetical protein [Sinimarinibacterium sp. NLF-5-8]|uniref:hypothetical protein n=1 Tax=Sinimarinibacterium sp. NLF-5-8 TaxID=2698684 RepID=UPI00137BD966|nr:hypothetical protein [Sinimarinibacterium sp. NLF-5-8]QHS10254.1 hypothetical protein GT972_08945 [Sinimarinibacterium sp. NLF-5-8]
MRSDRTQPRDFGQILIQTPQSIGGLLARAQHISRLNQSLAATWRDEPWIHHVRIANLRRNTVVIYVTSAAAMIPLRRHKAALLHWIQNVHRLPCTHIQISVCPAIPRHKPPSLSAGARRVQPRTAMSTPPQKQTTI